VAGGQFFNLFNLGKTPEALKDLQTKELKNGAHRWISVFCNCNLHNMGRAYSRGALCFPVADLGFRRGVPGRLAMLAVFGVPIQI